MSAEDVTQHSRPMRGSAENDSCLSFNVASPELYVRQLQQEFNMRLEGRVDERTRIARDLHDTILQSFQGLIPVFQTARNLLPGQSDRAAEMLDEGLHDAGEAIVEGRNAIQNLRAKPSLGPDLGTLLNAAGQELAHSSEAAGSAPAFRVVVEGSRKMLAPLLQDEIYRIGREMLRNAFRHAREHSADSSSSSIFSGAQSR